MPRGPGGKGITAYYLNPHTGARDKVGDVKKDKRPRRLPLELYPKMGGEARGRILEKARKGRAEGKSISPVLEAILDEEDEDNRGQKY